MMRIAQTITAADAYDRHRASGAASSQRARIVEFIKSRGGDWSIGELARELGMEKSTVSARLNECINETFQLVEKCRRKDRVSGILVRAVGLPFVGQGRLF